jgi:zinc transporter ZupT
MIEISKGEDDNKTITAAGFMGGSNNFTSLMKYTQPSFDMKKEHDIETSGSAPVMMSLSDVADPDSITLDQIEKLLRSHEEEIEILKTFIRSFV